MPSVFLYSDPHFGHQGVCKFLRNDGVTKLRPWDTAEESVKEFDDMGFVYDCFPEKLTEIIIDNYSIPGDQKY